MADGYGAGLFDSSGPKEFASEVGKISSALDAVKTAFSGFGTQAQQSLSGISTAVQNLVGQLSQLQQQLQNQGAGAGGLVTPGSPGWTGAGAPQPSATAGGGSGNTGSRDNAPNWSMANAPQPNANTGAAPSLSGTQDGTASQGPSQFPQQQQGSAQPQTTPSQTGGNGGGLLGMLQGSASGGSSMGQRAVQSMVPAAIGAATSYAGGLMQTAVQGATIGQMYAPAFGVSSRSLYVMPKGILAQNPQDYAQSNAYAIQNLGIAPGTQNWSSIMGPSGGLNQLMTLDPGLTRQQAAQSYGNMISPQVLNQGMAFGFNFTPGGKMDTPQQMYSQIWQRLTRNVPGGKPTGAQVEAWLRPGGPWSSNLASLGYQPGSAEYQGFVNYALTQVGVQGQGKSLGSGAGSGINLGTASGASQTPLGNTPAYAQLQAQSAQSGLETQAEPALAQAAKDLSEAAKTLYNAANPLASLLGGGLGGGGLTGMVGSVATMGGLAWGGKKLGGLLKGGLGNVASGGIGDLLKGGLGKLFGKGAADAGEQLAFDGMGDVAGGAAGGGLKAILNKLIGGNLGEDAAKLGMKGGLGDLLKGGLGRLTGGGLGNLLKSGVGRVTGGGIGNLLKGGLGKLIGGGAGEAAATGGEVAGLEGAGAALDATGVGAPIGLLLGAAGLGLGFHKQIGHFIGGAAHKIGGFFGGLFGGHKKSTSAPDGSDSSGDISALLSAKPPANSLLCCLTSEIKPNDNTLIAILTRPGQAQKPGLTRQQATLTSATFAAGTGAAGGGGAGGGTGGVGAGTASTPATPYSWSTAAGGGAAPDMSSMFHPSASSTASSSSSGGGGGGGGGAASTPTTNLPGSGNTQQAYNYFLGKGLKDFMSAGIVGNLAQESGVNPTSTSPGAFGVAQWTPPTALQAWAKQQNRDVNSLATQLDFLWYQLQSSESGALKMVQGSTDASSAAQAFEQGYERAGIPMMANRIKYAQNVLASKGAHYARGTQLIDRTQLALLHRGEAVVPAADNYSSGSSYNRNGAMGGNGGVYLNFKSGSIVLQVPPNSTQQDMDNLANQFVAAVAKPQVLASVRST